MLGEKVSNIYKNIENELLQPSLISPPLSSSYKPSMKKRVYNINNLSEKNIELNRSQNNIPLKNPDEFSFKLKKTELSPAENLLSTKLTRSYTINDNKNQISNIDKSFSQSEKLHQETEEDPDSILNYLVRRLSEQHKIKLEKFAEITPNKNNDELNNISNIKSDNGGLNNHLSIISNGKIISEINSNDGKNTVTQVLDNVKLSDIKNSGVESKILMTKSLYAQHKQINLKKEIENLSEKNNYEQLENSLNKNNKIITALSINEIETRNLFKINNKSNLATNEKSYPTETSSTKHILARNNDGAESLADEKKIKEEIVLIGDKKDIESLLENENNELYDLIIENSNLTSKLTAIENDINKKRIELIKNEDLNGKNISFDQKNKNDIEILIEDEEVENNFQKNSILDNKVKQTAKYLVGEITKISLNKMKIDELSDKISKKYFSNNLFTKHEILNNLLDSNDKEQFYDINKNNNNNKTREELFDYYSNLEKNLEQVRNEIDKLKKEAYDDLAYISEVLSTNEIQDKLNSNELIDFDQVYLKNDDDNISETFENRIENLNLIKSECNFEKRAEIENDEETQYLSQLNSIISTITPKTINNIHDSINKTSINNNNSNLNKNYLENHNENSQAYLTPAESWQTLVNENKSANSDKNNILNDLNIENEKNNSIKVINDDNQTDLDEDELTK
jgi:hypothetical protein